MKRILVTALALVLLTACDPVVNTPPPPATGQNDSFTFVIETFGTDMLPIAHRVNLTITVFGVDGKLAHKVDPSTGLEQRGSDQLIELEAVKTPFRYKVSGGDDVAGASLQVQFIGREFMSVECRVEVDGVMVPGSATRVSITGPVVVDLGDFRSGLVIANCVHLK